MKIPQSVTFYIDMNNLKKIGATFFSEGRFMKMSLLTQTVIIKFYWLIIFDHASLKTNMEIHDLLMHWLVIILSGRGFSFHTMTSIPL